ncbi:MAG: nitrogen regulation protein NR(II), partial [Candidatus Binatia bacterium]
MKTRSDSPEVKTDFPSDSWEHILASLEESITIIDHEGCIAYLNQTAEQLTCFSSAQTWGRPYTEAFSTNPWIIEIIQRTLSSGYSRMAGEGKLQGRLHRSTPVRLTCSPILNGKGTYLGLILVFHDLSYQKELAETALREDQLTHLGVLAAGLAHEIKNPLAGIRGAAQLLQGRVRNNPSAVEYTEVMIRQVDRLSDLLEQLLGLSTPPSLDMQPVNVHKILTEVLLLERETMSSQQRIQT